MKCKNEFRPLGIDKYNIQDCFWKYKMEIVREKMIPYQWRALNDEIKDAVPSHCIKNFKIAAGLEEGNFEGCVFQDSDLAKWIEAVGYTLIWHEDHKLEETADEIISIISKAQRPDGYLDTYYIINGLENRWTNVMDNHELYCAGHMIEAGIAYYLGTGKSTLLNVVKKLADCIDNTFGPAEDQIHAYPGHEIIEMALVRLYDVTEEKRYLKLAEYFINERGKKPIYFQQEAEKNNNTFHWKDSLFQYQYYQAGKPVREQTVAEGHAVRAVYLYSGMTDIARKMKDETLMQAVKILWRDVTKCQMYITGAIGSSEYGEAFTFPYDLPNDTIYGETCASIGLVFWARRMLESELDADYADVMERCLYNGCISGMSEDGTRFFYVNPLEIDPKACEKDQRKKHVSTERQKWFGCSCCPPNLARLIASIANYICSVNDDILAFHLYVGGEVETPFCNMKIKVDTQMPWNGTSVFTMKGNSEKFTIAFRIPGWCKNYSITINDKAVRNELKKGYIYISRRWDNDDKIKIIFDMQVERNYSHPQVKYNLGKTAVSRGPFIYCLEEIDNDSGLTRIYLPEKSCFSFQKGFVETGEIDLETMGYQLSTDNWEGQLYQHDKKDLYIEKKLHFIPYYLWNNRGTGEMIVWVNEKP